MTCPAPLLAALRVAMRVASLIVLTSCAASSSLAPASQVNFRATSAGIEITNTTSSRLFYAAAPLSIVPLFDLASCVDPTICRFVAATTTAMVPWPGATPEHEYRLYWWQARIDGARRATADSIRTVTLLRFP